MTRRLRNHRQTIDSCKVAAFLRDSGWSGVAAIARIAHGEWSQAFSFRLEPGTEYVVRFSALDEDFRKDMLATAFAAPNLPIPKVLAFGEAFDGFYAIAERAHGAYLDALDGEQLVRALPSVFSALERMRQADVSSHRRLWRRGTPTGMRPSSTWRDALLAIGSASGNPRTAGWRRRLEQSPTGTAPFETGLRKLHELIDGIPNVRHLVHADLLNYNVLVEGEPRLRGARLGLGNVWRLGFRHRVVRILAAVVPRVGKHRLGTGSPAPLRACWSGRARLRNPHAQLRDRDRPGQSGVLRV